MIERRFQVATLAVYVTSAFGLITSGFSAAGISSTFLMDALRRFAPTLPRRVNFVVGTEAIPQAPVQSSPIDHVLP